jgi:hydroxymethylpyrimidine kinase/phosphomethylpyrimidine kinase
VSPAAALPVVCSVGATDPWNAAGLGLDLLALAACGAYGVTVVAGVTAQDRAGIAARQALPADLVAAQFRSLREAGIAAYRVGALLDAATVAVVAGELGRTARPAVVDPVFAASGGGAFGDAAARAAFVRDLIPRATLLTPNLAEAALLTGVPAVTDLDGMEAAGRALVLAGARAVLVKGGHLAGAAVDLLVDGDGPATAFEAPRLPGSLRGTGCLLACAAAAALARGEPLVAAVAFARGFVRERFAAAHERGGMRTAY